MYVHVIDVNQWETCSWVTSAFEITFYEISVCRRRLTPTVKQTMLCFDMQSTDLN